MSALCYIYQIINLFCCGKEFTRQYLMLGKHYCQHWKYRSGMFQFQTCFLKGRLNLLLQKYTTSTPVKLQSQLSKENNLDFTWDYSLVLQFSFLYTSSSSLAHLISSACCLTAKIFKSSWVGLNFPISEIECQFRCSNKSEKLEVLGVTLHRKLWSTAIFYMKKYPS